MKRATKGKAKTSRVFISHATPSSNIDAAVFECLKAWFAMHPPPHPEKPDLRKEASKEWMLLLARVGSSAKLAEYLDTTAMSVTRWVSGDNTPDPLMLLKLRALAASLGLPPPV